MPPNAPVFDPWANYWQPGGGGRKGKPDYRQKKKKKGNNGQGDWQLQGQGQPVTRPTPQNGGNTTVNNPPQNVMQENKVMHVLPGTVTASIVKEMHGGS